MKKFYIEGAFNFTCEAKDEKDAESKMLDFQHQLYRGDIKKFNKDSSQVLPINALRKTREIPSIQEIGSYE